ncbi:hypothetical protein KO498_03520 [Lentibacter algarum]|uniref:hypothetical protein n=1 Tax=Lentibacter algarum TaxID=576131 RepID=UPI001C070200|nr:hypothetical protein [Lentibacter algarum]MBU2980875.1 hypothetical protein [Lentibacter algarum]
MLKNLLAKMTKSPAETQRQTVERALAEINAVMGDMDVKPKLSFVPDTGEISLELPEQMPDEALALPAPGLEAEPEKKAA